MPGSIELVARAVRQGRVSAAEVVAAALDRVERLDEPLNAVVALRAEEALSEARALDAQQATGEVQGQLSGVPVLVKDIEDVAGMRTTYGSVLFAESSPALSDGLVPARLRSAGAIVVGKTNTPEFATEGFTSNLLFGPTRNPWSIEWSSGGSSGGSAVAPATGMVPVATGTDGGGSIRIPSAFCGLIGLKPTAGVVPRRPIPDWIDFSTDGPMATSASDLRLLLSVMAGPEPGDPTALPRWEPGPSRRSDRLLAATRMTPGGPLPAEVEERFHSALASLEEALSLEAEMLVPEEPLWSGDPDADWFVIATTEHVNRLGRAWVGEHLHEMHPAASAFLRQGLGISIDAYLDARRRRFDHVRDLDLLLDGNTVLASPTMAAAGFLADGRLKPDDEVGALPSSVYNTAAQNMTGHPAISLPAGRMGNGVPFGLQVTAPRFRDDLLLDLAGLWEQAHPWPRVAPDYEPFESALGLE